MYCTSKKNLSISIFQIWPHSKYPLRPVGKMVLNRNPTNYFNDVEQSAYSPAHMIPGVEASPDKMLQVCFKNSFFFKMSIRNTGNQFD